MKSSKATAAVIPTTDKDVRPALRRYTTPGVALLGQVLEISGVASVVVPPTMWDSELYLPDAPTR